MGSQPLFPWGYRGRDSCSGACLVPREAQALSAFVQEEAKEHTGYGDFLHIQRARSREVGIEPRSFFTSLTVLAYIPSSCLSSEPLTLSLLPCHRVGA